MPEIDCDHQSEPKYPLPPVLQPGNRSLIPAADASPAAPSHEYHDSVSYQCDRKDSARTDPRDPLLQTGNR